MKFYFFASVLVLFGAVFFFVAEPGWLIFVFAWTIAIACNSSFRTLTRIGVGVVGSAILVTHCLGYKVYGSATIHDNGPALEHPSEVASFKPPNMIVTKGGQELPIKGITFSEYIFSMPFEDFTRYVNRDRRPLLIERTDSKSGILFEYRCSYWCGNTFFPTLFPERLPKYMKSDFGEYLLSLGFAEKSE